MLSRKLVSLSPLLAGLLGVTLGCSASTPPRAPNAPCSNCDSSPASPDADGGARDASTMADVRDAQTSPDVGTTNPAGLTHDEVVPTSTAPRPAVAERYRDPVYNTVVRRVSDRSERPVPGDGGNTHQGGFEVQIYSQLQAFSPSGQFVLLSHDTRPFYFVRRVDNLSKVEGLDTSDVHVPRWLRTEPQTLLHYDLNDDSQVDVLLTDVATKTTRKLATLDGYQTVCGNESFDETSHDGRWLAGMARRDGESTSGNCRSAPDRNDIFAFDLTTGEFGAKIDVRALHEGACGITDRSRCSDPTCGQIDWVAPSPLGNYLMVQWVPRGTERCHGLEAFDLRTGDFVGRVTDHPEHGDLGVSEGREFFMTFEGTTVSYSWLPGPAKGRAKSTALLPLASGLPDHISCQGPDGTCLVTTGPSNGARAAFEAEIMTVGIDGEVRRLTQHHSSECGYWAQPRATWSRDGRYAIFSSDWGVNSCQVPDDYPDRLRIGRVDPYIIELSP